MPRLNLHLRSSICFALLALTSAMALAETPPAPEVAATPNDVTVELNSKAIVPNPVVPPIQPLAPVPAPTATPKSLSKSERQAILDEHTSTCGKQYSGKIQSEVRLACQSPTEDFDSIGADLARTRCRMAYGEEPRLVMSCLIGVMIYEDLINQRDNFRIKQRLCAEHYPAHTELDAVLQESCLIGAHSPELLKITNRSHFEICATINPERSFIGPCAVGRSLTTDAGAPQTIGQQNKICEQFFDHRQFHIGYRSCLAARGLGPQIPEKLPDAMKACANVIANAENDTERAACIVGLNIFRRGDKIEDLTKRFGKCGDTKVSYENRDFLACLTAASLIDLADRPHASEGCKDVYRNKKSRGRNDCLESITQL